MFTWNPCLELLDGGEAVVVVCLQGVVPATKLVLHHWLQLSFLCQAFPLSSSKFFCLTALSLRSRNGGTFKYGNFLVIIEKLG